MSDRDKQEIARKVIAAIDFPPGLWIWPPAYEMVERAEISFTEALDDGVRPVAEMYGNQLVKAWRAAGRAWVAAGRP